MTSRSWIWLSRRIAAILDASPVAVVRYEVADRQKFAVIPATRLGTLLSPPTFE